MLEQKSMLANVMLLEKCKNNEEVYKVSQKIVANNSNNEDLRELKKIVFYLYGNIDKESMSKLLNLIEESESEEEMSTIRERLTKEYYGMEKKGAREGARKEKNNIIIRMLHMNLSNEFIAEVTDTKEEQINKIKKELESSKA